MRFLAVVAAITFVGCTDARPDGERSARSPAMADSSHSGEDGGAHVGAMHPNEPAAPAPPGELPTAHGGASAEPERAPDASAQDAAPPPGDAEVELPDAELPDAELPDAELPDAERPDANVEPPDAASPPNDAGSDAANAAGVDAGQEQHDGFTFLSDVDRGPNIHIEPGALSAEWRTLATSGVRSTRAIAPGEGVFYYEATLAEAFDLLTIGVATALAPLDRTAGSSDQSFGLDSGGQLYSGGNFLASFAATSRSFGFVVDYRGEHPIVHVLAELRDRPAVLRSETLSAIAEPLFIHLAGIRRTPETHVTINPGNDRVNTPFAFDPDAVLRAAGLTDTAQALVLGWGATHAGTWNEPPLLLAPSGSTVAAGTPVTLTASASDVEDGELSAAIVWEVLSTGYGPERVAGAGPSFAFTPQVLGTHPVRVTVTDAGGKRARSLVDVNALGTLPQFADVRMTPDVGSGDGIAVADDGLRVRWTAQGKQGIRANQGLYGGFWYFEAQRLIAALNQGAGLVIGAASLAPYPFNDTPPSCSINTAGGVFQNLIFRQPPPGDDVEHYGFAVDYRGRSPIVYFVWNDALAGTLQLVDATVPIYPMLYGNPTGAGAEWDLAINFGAAPFRYDPIAVLGAAGIDTSALRPCWGEANAACPAPPAQ